MNQISLSDDAGIDTDEVRNWIKEGERTYVYFKTGDPTRYTGEAKAAFDEWMAGNSPSCQTCKVFDDDEERCTWTIGHVSFPKCYEAEEADEAAHIEKLTAMAYKQGVRAGREEMDEFYFKRAIPSCQTCVYHDWKISPCQLPIGVETFPNCYTERPGPSGTADGETMEAFVAWARGERQAEAEEAATEAPRHTHTHVHDSVGGHSRHTHREQPVPWATGRIDCEDCISWHSTEHRCMVAGQTCHYA